MGIPVRWPLAPVYVYFDRTCREQSYPMVFAVTTCRDWRGQKRTYDKHTGTDFVVPIGTPVVAPARGRVLKVDWEPVGGHFLWLDHGGGYATTYHHLSKVLVSVGDEVERGEMIARTGATGAAIETFWPLVPPHLHFSVLVDGVPIDPYSCPEDPLTPGFWEGGEPRPFDGASALDLDLPMSMVEKDDLLAAYREDPILGPNFVPILSEIAPDRFSLGPGWNVFSKRPRLQLSLPFRRREVAGIWEG